MKFSVPNSFKHPPVCYSRTVLTTRDRRPIQSATHDFFIHEKSSHEIISGLKIEIVREQW